MLQNILDNKKDFIDEPEKRNRLEVEAQGGTQRTAVTALQEVVLDGNEIEGLVLGSGQVAAP